MEPTRMMLASIQNSKSFTREFIFLFSFFFLFSSTRIYYQQKKGKKNKRQG